jgi:hypothetical protein
VAFAGALNVIEQHLVAAGTALSNPIRNVKSGPPLALGERLIRCYYLGDTDSELIPDSLTDNTLAERVRVSAYWPIADAGATAADLRDVEIQALKAQIKNRLVGDDKLGGNCAGITVGDFAVAYVQVEGGWYAELETDVLVHLIDTDTIAD